MDDVVNAVVSVLKDYEDISEIVPLAGGAEFKIGSVQFEIILTDKTKFPLVLTVDNLQQFPHFLIRPFSLNGKQYRCICLHQSGEFVEYLFSLEEKVRLSIDKLIFLINLPCSQVVQEYHKEFLYYWNLTCKCDNKYNQKYQLFLDGEEKFQWLEQQVFPNNEIRVTDTNRFFNDSHLKKFSVKYPALYIPIENCTDVIPPLNEIPWGAKELCDLMFSTDVQHISKDAFIELSSKTYSYDTILLIFKVKNYCFACVVEFSNAGSAKLNNKFQSQIKRVIPIIIERRDFTFLNQQIGNSISTDIVTVIGAGSLGSYVVAELARSGYKNIAVMDNDSFEAPNTFRHRALCGAYRRKSEVIAFETSLLHPEININAIPQSLTVENIESVICKSDILIFTVGSSDVLLNANREIVSLGIKKPVYYAWLEHDGETSHVAVITDASEGCYECLYTNDEGHLDRNIVNKSDDEKIQYIHNGCGGTRVAYGNKTLLTATALLLKALKEHKSGNAVYSYYNDAAHKKPFPQNERCNCCGLQSTKRKV